MGRFGDRDCWRRGALLRVIILATSWTQHKLAFQFEVATPPY